MKKKYSDPLIFASRLLIEPIDLNDSQEVVEPPDAIGGNGRAKSIFSVNGASATSASEDSLTIVNPVEEAVTSASTSVTAGVTSEGSGNAVSETITSSPLEVEPIIDEIVPEVTEEAATAGTTVY